MLDFSLGLNPEPLSQNSENESLAAPVSQAKIGAEHESLEAAAPEPEKAPQLKDVGPRLEGVAVLLVEDTPDMRRLIGRILSSAGARVYGASSAHEAREILHQFMPEVIVSDIAMPEEDGISFIKDLREDEMTTGDHIPAIALTAFPADDLREVALRSGFEAYLTKPILVATLVSTLERVIAHATSRRH